MAITVARVRGIPIQLHLTFLLLLPVFGYLMGMGYFRPGSGGMPTTMGWVWGALLAVGLFASVLVHELAHSLMALREGVAVRSILLLPIGGVSGFEEIPKEPGKEFRITIVGPLTNFAMGIPLFLLAPALPEVVEMLPRFVYSLGALNLAVGAFNLLVPAFPMDGGRLVRAALARRMGHLRATHVASMLGQGIAVLFGVLGLLSFGSGGWLLLLIAAFVFMGARGEENSTRLSATLDPFDVADLMTRDVQTLPRDATVEDALEQMLARKRLVLPVRADDAANPRVERVLGVVDLEALQTVPEGSRHKVTVETLVRTEFERARPSDPAADLGRLLTGGRGPVLVLDREGMLAGIVTRTDVARFTQIATATHMRGRGERGA